MRNPITTLGGRPLLFLCCAVVCFLGLTCIPVDDLGDYWDKGIVDPGLAGDWQQVGADLPSGDRYVSFHKAGTFYEETEVSADQPDRTPDGPQRQVRTLVVGKHRFMMIRQPMPASSPSSTSSSKPQSTERMLCGLERYAIEDGKLVIYALDEKVLAQAIASGKMNGSVPRESATRDDSEDFDEPRIKKLEEKTVAALGELADDAKNWKATVKYSPVKDLAKALEASRRYPATQGTAENSRVQIQLPDLKYLANGKEDVLLRQLAASPEWRVFQDGKDIVAYRRELSNGRWQVSLNGYVSKDSSDAEMEARQTRSLFRFSKDRVEALARDRYVTKADPLAGKVELVLRKYQGIESYLIVGQGALWFECFDQARTEPRTQTREALKWLTEFLGAVRKSEDEILKNGYAARLLPEGSIKKGKPTIEVEDGFQGGIYDVYAWVNPAAEGEVYLKVSAVKTGARLSEERLTPRSNEIIGWSKDSDLLFFYNSNITVYEGERGHPYDARFELWFKDKKSGAEKKLVETTRSISGWQR